MTSSDHPSLVDRIDAWLPQTQCTRCGYPRCRDYAAAIARGEADINQCPPGDDATIHGLAAVLNVPAKPLNPAFGRHEPRKRAVIDESRCIGCRKCLIVCPVDAIVGARKWMHTVMADDCTGCELCLPPCPVDCIALVPVARPESSAERWPEYPVSETNTWRVRTERRLARRAARRAARSETVRESTEALRHPPTPEKIREEIRAAVERARRKRETSSDR